MDDASGHPDVSKRSGLRGGRRLSSLIVVCALLLAAVLVPVLVQSAQAGSTQTDRRVLLIGGPGGGTSDPTTAAWAAGLTNQGVAYTEVDATGTVGVGTESVTLPSLTSSPTQGLYDGVVIADDPADFAAGQLSALLSYESTFGARQIDGYAFPTAAYGLTDITSSAVNETANLTAAGLVTFPSLTGPVPLAAGTYGYPATVATGLPTGASETPLLSDTTGVLMGIYQHPTAVQDPSDPQAGVAELTILFNYNAAQSQWLLLGPVLIDWVMGEVNPTITSATTATAKAGSTFSFTVLTTGLPTPALSEAGALPGGIAFTDNGNGTATIGGTVVQGTTGSYPITISATNGVPPDASQSFTLTVVKASQQYDLVGSDGGVFVFGQVGGFYGSLPGLGVHVNNIVGIVPTSDNKGYFLVGSDGGVFAFGDAPFENSLPGLGVHVNNIVGIAPTSDNKGYFLVGSDGGTFAFGDAAFEGSLPGLGVHVNDIAGIALNGRNGYWLVSTGGAVYALGGAGYFGGLGGASTTPMVGIAATQSGNGYWLVGRTGSVFAYGDAKFYGSLPALGVSVNNVVALVPTPDQLGYWLIGSDGGVFAFGDAQEIGSLPGLGISVNNIVGAVPTS